MNEVVVSAWAQISGECEIKYHVAPEEAEIQVGGRSGFIIFASEAGLAHLIEQSTKALGALRALRDTP
ncbi:hypothetical protein SAMN05421504_10349 [Amycolatopsis xylanica]|uniref:Uncharacterized protein n=1 Tax=Amycolatopsis xylanica TaxID=589385 RepID=A0A1H3CIW5_9PSEU|nr:hypothetical protein [Amycolatopsis xylanica]SDX54055.1 hypothetical protein SAMN05421504_10349 [Amycolatopsis xylanica]